MSDMDFVGVVGELRAWAGRRVTVIVSHAGDRHPAATLVGALYGPVGQPERFEETRELYGAIVLGDLDPRARDWLVETHLTPTAGEVLHFAVGTGLPEHGCYFTLDEAKFTTAALGEGLTLPPTPMLTIVSGDAVVAVVIAPSEE